MDVFDYYVSGLKLFHQVPRFTKKAMENALAVDVTLNDWLQSFHYTVLLFDPQLNPNSSCIKSDEIDQTIVAYVSLERLQTLKHLGIKNGLIVSDASHTLSESYGVLDALNGALDPAIVIIKNSGQLVHMATGPAVFPVDASAVRALLKKISD